MSRRPDRLICTMSPWPLYIVVYWKENLYSKANRPTTSCPTLLLYMSQQILYWTKHRWEISSGYKIHTIINHRFTKNIHTYICVCKLSVLFDHAGDLIMRRLCILSSLLAIMVQIEFEIQMGIFIVNGNAMHMQSLYHQSRKCTCVCVKLFGALCNGECAFSKVFWKTRKCI